MPFLLRAKRARKAQNRHRNRTEQALDFEPPPQARRAGEDDELPREFERFLQTGQPEDEPVLLNAIFTIFAIFASAQPPAASRHRHYLAFRRELPVRGGGRVAESAPVA